jgi:plasmid maintenance system antidote protein VapI
MKKNEIKVEQVLDITQSGAVREAIRNAAKKQSNERKLRNEMLSIQYVMEDYVRDYNIDTSSEAYRVLDFVKMFLSVLDLRQKELAKAFGMDQSNMRKYLTGKRSLNDDIVLKLSGFTHTKPSLWIKVETKYKSRHADKLEDRVEEYRHKYGYENFV